MVLPPEKVDRVVNTLETLKAEMAELRESVHLSKGVTELAMKHRDDAERDLVQALQDVARALEVIRPFAERAVEVDNVEVVRKHCHEGTVAVDLTTLRLARKFYYEFMERKYDEI